MAQPHAGRARNVAQYVSIAITNKVLCLNYVIKVVNVSLGPSQFTVKLHDSETLRPRIITWRINGRKMSIKHVYNFYLCASGENSLMPIRRQRLLYTLAVLLASLVAGCAGCKEQSSQMQILPPAAAANSSSPAVTNMNAAPASNANASSSNKSAIDACKLLTKEEIKTIQRDTLKDTTLTAPSDGPFIVSQCFYATNNFVNSVSLTVTQQSSNAGAKNIREFWKEKLRSQGSHDTERERERDNKAKASEEEEEGAPPERVKGVGEEAYSVGNAKFGALYVLKGNKILRISVGGSHSQPERIQKMKSLAQYAITRL